jgi:hypothetical protein
MKKKVDTAGGKMKSPATTRSTAGSGFRFEDQVAAWLLLKALRGQELPGVSGTVARVQMQVDALGWHLDDILFTVNATPDDVRHLAISCKSNVQVSAAGLPPDFMERAWKQWSPPNAGPMRQDVDCLMLATRQRHIAFQATWSEIKLAAADADATLGLSRIMATASYQRVFMSVKNPAVAAGLAVSDEDVLALIRRIEIMPLDFDIAGGEYQSLAENECRSLLTSGSLVEAREFWADLVGRAEQARLSPSTLDVATLWQELRSKYILNDHPDFAAAWRRLRAVTTDYLAEIRTDLPSGYVLARETDVEKIENAILGEAVCVVYGESGTGKSALVKMTLESKFPDAAQVWLGPEQLELASSETTRSAFGLTASLLDVLRSSSKAQTILILDAAERLTDGCVARTKTLVTALAAETPATGCRVVIVGQSDAGVSGVLRILAGSVSTRPVEIPRLDVDDVSDVLRATTGLRWLAAQDEAVSALRNLKALAWVIEGAALFPVESGVTQLSLTTIADRLWRYWTGDKLSLQRLLMKLGEREASFEHSFALTSFDGAEVGELDALPKACPLRIGNNNRFQFEHDLAADWARFQRLKQDGSDVQAWARFAGNPLWNNALRMLGQFLLRQPDGERTQWDTAFEEAERQNETMLLAADILLDALFLDPQAETFLNERSDMLFANNAKRLMRLLQRFEHVASVPGGQPNLPSGGLDISLYLEAQYRTPIFVRWPAVANFLTQHRDRVVALLSPVVAAVCQRWLTSTPVMLGRDIYMPYRKEFANLALGMARELQYANEITAVWLRDPEKTIYGAAFTSAADLPDEVAQWALEMVGRRPVRADVVSRILEFKKQEAEERRKKLETDPEFRAKQQGRRFPPSVAFSSSRKLPPWPLGPQRRVENRFREAVLGSASFQAVMHARPVIASEVLLAAIIEDSPEEEYGNRTRFEHELGIEYDHEGYPTAYWKSPFYAFLQISPDAALSGLKQLVDFCTDRWVDEVRSDGGQPTPVSLTLTDGTALSFNGNFRVFCWSQENSNRNGQLHSALAALEKWLCGLIDRGTDAAPYLDDLLRTSHSVAVVGVVMNVGKYRPGLFKGPLKPLLGEHLFYIWDYHRVDSAAHGADFTSWARGGELMFQMGKDWVLAPYRKAKLQQVAADLLTADNDIAEFLLAATKTWTPPVEEKEAVEFRVLVAELDHRNYSLACDPVSRVEKREFSYPAEVTEAIAGFNKHANVARQILNLPDRCRTVFDRPGTLTSDSAAYLAEMMASASEGTDVDLTDDFKCVARAAAAATLLVKAPEWLAENGAVAKRAREIVTALIDGIGSASSAIQKRSIHGSREMEFAARVAVEDWMATPSKETDEAVMRIVASGDDQSVVVLFGVAYQNRQKLGAAWWRLLYLAVLRAGLSILAPRYGDEDDNEPRWQRWMYWLRTRRISGIPTTIADIDPLGIARRVEWFERRRWQQRYARDGHPRDINPDRRMSGGLDTHFLEKAFGWLFAEGHGLPDLEEQAVLLGAFWSHEAWCLRGSVEEDDKDFKSKGSLGHTIAWSLAYLSLSSTPGQAIAIWKQVFALGPRGHHAISAFLTQWFVLIKEETDLSEFAKRWRPMIEYLLTDEQWAADGRWYHAQQLERQALAFGAGSFITRGSKHATLIGGMRDLYKVWADKRLPSDQDNMAGFCSFLSTDAGRALRIDGLQWFADVIRAHPETGRWYRDSTSDAFAALLDAVVLEDSDELLKNSTARQALLELTAHAVARQLPRSMPLQERVRRLR